MLSSRSTLPLLLCAACPPAAGTADAPLAAADASSSDAPAPDAPPPLPPLFDLAAIADPVAAGCAFTGQHTTYSGATALDAWSLSFNSLEVEGGVPRSIRMRGFAARPAGATDLPGVVLAHGLGGYASEADAASLAAELGTFVVAYSGPGSGSDASNTSEGVPAMDGDGRRLFDTLPDRRGSWFWGHTVAAMRAVTCLAGRADVDATRLGITGFSAGGVVSLVVAGVDPRVGAAVPLSGTLAWDVAVEAAVWQHDLLAGAGYTTASEQWLRLLAWLDADALLAATPAAVLMVDGSGDEFFPLTAFASTYAALPAGRRRLALAANFDHGCYSLASVEDPATIAERADRRTRGGQRAWFAHHFATDARYACLPATPTLSLAPSAGSTVVAVGADESCARLEVEAVHAWTSSDGALTFSDLALTPYGGGLYGGVLPFVVDATLVVFGDVEYRTDDLVLPERFALATEPVLPGGFVPTIRSLATCLP